MLFMTTRRFCSFQPTVTRSFPAPAKPQKWAKERGRGFTVNVPLPPQRDDTDFGNVYRHILVPLALEFKPQLILISAGFDTHADDPIGGMRVTERGFARIADIILDIARKTCGGKVAAVLEGGYDLAALRRSVKAVLQTLRDGSARTRSSLWKKRMPITCACRK